MILTQSVSAAGAHRVSYHMATHTARDLGRWLDDLGRDHSLATMELGWLDVPPCPSRAPNQCAALARP